MAGSYVAVEVASMFTLGTVSFYAIVLYIRMRFQQMTKQFEGISAKNIDSLQLLIRDHDRVTVMTKDNDIFFSKHLGIITFMHR